MDALEHLANEVEEYSPRSHLTATELHDLLQIALTTSWVVNPASPGRGSLTLGGVLNREVYVDHLHEATVHLKAAVRQIDTNVLMAESRNPGQ